MLVVDIAKAILTPILTLLGGMRRVRVLVHRGFISGDLNEKLFVDVTNLSHSRDVEITRVWFDVLPHVEVLNPQRPLPKRLRPDESWQIWCDSQAVLGWNIERLARVRLSSGKVVKSSRRDSRDVAPAGIIPGP